LALGQRECQQQKKKGGAGMQIIGAIQEQEARRSLGRISILG